MSDKNTKVYVYGKSTTGTLGDIEALETPDELTPWFEDKKVTREGFLVSNEIFYTLKQLTNEEVAKIGVIYLGFVDTPYFYMSEEINGQYVTYVTSDPTGPGMVLYPVTWENARIYIFRSGEGSICYQ